MGAETLLQSLLQRKSLGIKSPVNSGRAQTVEDAGGAAPARVQVPSWNAQLVPTQQQHAMCERNPIFDALLPTKTKTNIQVV
jgi:hypothetical protein